MRSQVGTFSVQQLIILHAPAKKSEETQRKVHVVRGRKAKGLIETKILRHVARLIDVVQIHCHPAIHLRVAPAPFFDSACASTATSTLTIQDPKGNLSGIFFGAIDILAVVPIYSRGSWTARDSDGTGPSRALATAIGDDAVGWHRLVGLATVGCKAR